MVTFLYGPTLKSILDYWKNDSFEYMDLSWQSDVPAFQHTVLTSHSFPSKMQMYLNFMAVVTVHRDFGAQENKSVTASTFSPLFAMK